MKLSDLQPGTYQVEEPAPARLSGLHPDSYTVESHAGAPAAPSTFEAGARGLAQGVTLGFGDELGGGAEALLEKLGGAHEELAGLYRRHRDAIRAGNEKARVAHPYVYGASEIGGGVLPVLATGGAGAGLGGAAALGAAAGLGGSNADLTRGDVGGAALDTAKGAVLGGVAQGAGEHVVAPVIRGAARKLGTAAEDLAVRHLAPTAGVKRAIGKEGLRDVGREALDAGAIRPGAKVETTAANLHDAAEAAGAVKGDIVNASPATVDPAKLGARIDQDVVAPLSQTTEGKSVADYIRGKRDALMQDLGTQPVPVSRIEAEKMAVNQGINWNAEPKLKSGAVRGYADALRGASEEAINDPAFGAAKRAFGNLSQGAKMAERTASLEGGGLASHMTDVGVGHAAATAAMHGNPVGLAIAGGRAATKGRLSSTAAWSADQVAKVLERAANSPDGRAYIAPLRAAAARGPEAVATTHYILSQTDPHYQQLLKDEQQ